jgi:hypothetical protein
MLEYLTRKDLVAIATLVWVVRRTCHHLLPVGRRALWKRGAILFGCRRTCIPRDLSLLGWQALVIILISSPVGEETILFRVDICI